MTTNRIPLVYDGTDIRRAGSGDVLVDPNGVPFVTVGPNWSLNPGGRLTNSASYPEGLRTTGSRYLYYVPYVTNKIALWNGSIMIESTIPPASSPLTLDVAASTGTYCIDVYAYDNAGTLALEIVPWSTYSARTATVPVIGANTGFYVKTGDETRRYLGTYWTGDLGAGHKVFYDADSYAITYWTVIRHTFWNYYNRLRKYMTNEYGSSFNSSQAPYGSAQSIYICHGMQCDAVVASINNYYSTNNTAGQIVYDVLLLAQGTAAWGTSTPYAGMSYVSNNNYGDQRFRAHPYFFGPGMYGYGYGYAVSGGTGTWYYPTVSVDYMS